MPISYNTAYEHSATVPEGDVIRQDPETVDEILHPEATVTIYVSLGPGAWFEVDANATEATRTRYAMFIAVRMNFSSSPFRVWSGYGQVTLFGETYIGLGKLGRVSTAPERSNLTFERKTYQLAGTEVNPALIPESELEVSFGRSVVEYLGFLSEDGQLLADPEVLFEGEISNIRRVDGKEPLIEVNAENRLSMLDRTDGWRYTHQHQQQFYDVTPPDLGFNEVKRLELGEIFWGGSRVSPSGGGGRPQPMRPLV